MAVRKHIINIPLAVGIDTRSDPKLLPPSKVVDTVNGVFSTEPGALCKRPGRSALDDSTLDGDGLEVGTQLHDYNGQLVLYGDTTVNSYSPDQSRWSEVAEAGEWCGWGTTVDRVYGGKRIRGADSATLGGIQVIAWTEYTESITADAVYYRIIDRASGTIIADHQLANPIPVNSSCPRVLAVGSKIHIYSVVENNPGVIHQIRVKVIDPSDPSALTASIAASSILLFSDVYIGIDIYGQDGYVFDAVTRWDNTAALLAYGRATTGMRLAWVLPSGALGNGSNGFAAPANVPTTIGVSAVDSVPTTSYAVAVALRHDDAVLAVAWDGAGHGAKVATCSSAFSFASGWYANPQLTGNDIGNADCPVITIAYSADDLNVHVLAQNEDKIIESATLLASNGSGAGAQLKWFAGLSSHIFEVNGRLYLHATHVPYSGTSHSLQPSYFLLDIDGNVLGRPVKQGLDHQVTTGVSPDLGLSLPRVDTGVEGEHLFVLPHRVDLADTSQADLNRGITQVVYEPEAKHAQSVASFNGVQVTGGPQVWEFDGSRIAELGFHLFPEGVEVQSATGGGSLTPGTYFYRFYYEFTNRLGQRYQSAGPVFEATVDIGDDQLDITFPALTMTQKFADVRLVGYRTPEGGGDVYYRAFEINDGALIGTISDTMGDAELETRELDYQNSTDGAAEVPNFSPPSMRGIVAGPDRLWGINNENRKQLVHSKLVNSANSGGINHFPEFMVELPEDIVSIQHHAGRVYAFAEKSVYAFMGQGPSNVSVAGDFGGEFGAPDSLTRSTGCSNPRSIVDTPLGWMTASNRGLYLVGRDGSERFLGADVKLYDEQDFTAAVCLEDVHQVRWLSSSGRCLVYDWEFNQWATFDGITGGAACVHDGVFHHVDGAGAVYRETPGAYLDDEEGFTQQVTLAPIKGSGVQDFGRWRFLSLLGESKTAGHKIKIEIRKDYSESSWTEIATILVSKLPSAKLRIPRNFTKAQSIQLRFTEILPDGDPGEGYSLSMVSIEAGIKPMPALAKQAPAA